MEEIVRQRINPPAVILTVTGETVNLSFHIMQNQLTKIRVAALRRVVCSIC